MTETRRLYGRRRVPPRVRDPHPDARVEAELQRILSLRRAAGRAEQHVMNLQEEAQKARIHARRNAGDYDGREANNLAKEYVLEIRQEEKRITEIHGEIAACISELSDTDLSFLEPRPRAD